MPIYDFICSKCEHSFTVRTSFSRKKEVHCPECNSDHIKEDYRGYGSGIFTQKSRPATKNRPFT